MSYAVKEIFYSIQGEGANMGRPAVFCRFTGCNLWSGKEEDRQHAICKFCDTDFLGTDGDRGGVYATAVALSKAMKVCWTDHAGVSVARPFVICTGGEPLLQVNKELVSALHEDGFEIALETNGTRIPPEGIDWICVSPKAGSRHVLKHGHELKLVFPQDGLDPANLLDLDFSHFFLQPMDGSSLEQNTAFALDYCLRHPQWRLSMQIHKILSLR